MLILALIVLTQDPTSPYGPVERISPKDVAFPMFGCFDDQGRLYLTESSGGDLYLELRKQVRKCRIRRIDGATSTVFAEGLVPSMGLAWRDGKLYAADPPDLITLEDTDGDGVADKRTVILSGFGAKDNGSLHGLIFGPDGLLYMTTGSPDGYDIQGIRGVSGALLRCRPDGSNFEVLARGFENLVEVVFLPNGDILGTDNWWQKPAGGVRDAIVHILEGGLYPYAPDVGTKQPVSGVELPAVALFPAVALSGLVRRGPELFSAQHNTRKVQRHVLVPKGSTWVSEDHDAVVSESPDFRPADVLLSPDGASLIVVDTGGWYVEHCPTGKIQKTFAKGGVWRVKLPPPPPEPKWPGRNIPEEILPALEEDVDPHQEHRLVHALRGKIGPEAHRHPHPRVRKAALHLLEAPRDAVLAAVGDRDPALRAAGLKILQSRADWAAEAVGLVRAAQDPAALRGCVLAFQKDPAIQAAVADGLKGPSRALFLDAISETTLKAFPSTWEEGVRAALDEPSTRAAAVRVIAGLRLPMFDERLEGLRDLEALRARVTRKPKLKAEDVDFLLERLADRSDAPGRLAAAEILSRARMRDVELLRALRATKGDPLISPSTLLLGLKETTDAASALAVELADAVKAGWRPSEKDFDEALKRLPEEARGFAEPAKDVLKKAAEEGKAKIAKHEALLGGGDAARGREVFFNKKAACGQCHAVGAEGGKVGPDLTKIGAVRAGRDLLESILVPSSTFAQGYEPYAVATSDGDVLGGLIAKQTADALTLRDASGKETLVRRERIREMKRAEKSVMPENLEQAMTPAEFRDLLAFLQSLK